MVTFYTVGHSNHTAEAFLELLRLHGITAIVDVRSSPYSRFAPQFNRRVVAEWLSGSRIDYEFLGDCLGARPSDPLSYRGRAVDFSLLCQRDYFQRGLDRLRDGASRRTLAILCSEKDPIQCHRMILICRHLRGEDSAIRHILESGELEDNRAAERRLMESLKMPATDLFLSTADLVEEAYNRQGERIAHHEDEEARQAPSFAPA